MLTSICFGELEYYFYQQLKKLFDENLFCSFIFFFVGMPYFHIKASTPRAFQLQQHHQQQLQQQQ